MDMFAVDNDPIVALSVGGAIGVAGLVIVALAARWAWRWIVGGNRKPDAVKDVSPAVLVETIVPLPAGAGADVTTADLLVVKSNLLAVVRQVEDLERRMRIGGAAQLNPKVIRLGRG